MAHAQLDPDQRPVHCIRIIRLRLRLAGMERVELPVSPADVHMRFNRVADSGLIINVISVHEDPSAAPSRESRRAWVKRKEYTPRATFGPFTEVYIWEAHLGFLPTKAVALVPGDDSASLHGELAALILLSHHASVFLVLGLVLCWLLRLFLVPCIAPTSELALGARDNARRQLFQVHTLRTEIRSGHLIRNRPGLPNPPGPLSEITSEIVASGAESSWLKGTLDDATAARSLCPLFALDAPVLVFQPFFPKQALPERHVWPLRSSLDVNERQLGQ